MRSFLLPRRSGAYLSHDRSRTLIGPAYPRIMRIVPLILALIAVCLLAGMKASRADAVPPPPSSLSIAAEKLDKQLDGYRRQALNGDASHVADMIQMLRKGSGSGGRYTLLRALARLGATQALPAINEVIKTGDSNSNFAKAARLRLLAETEPTPAAKVARFFRELGETPAQLNAALDAYRKHPTTRIEFSYPMETYALEELADMLYHGPYDDLMAQPLMAQVDFSLYGEALEKSLMAPLPAAEQRLRLVEQLAHATGRNLHTSQLLMDLGRGEAGEVAFRKLEEMDAHRAEYKPSGFLNIFDVLYASGDHFRSPFWHKFQNDPDPVIADRADMPRGDNFAYGY